MYNVIILGMVVNVLVALVLFGIPAFLVRKFVLKRPMKTWTSLLLGMVLGYLYCYIIEVPQDSLVIAVGIIAIVCEIILHTPWKSQRNATSRVVCPKGKIKAHNLSLKDFSENKKPE